MMKRLEQVAALVVAAGLAIVLGWQGVTAAWITLVLLVLEDIHWSDDDSLDLIAYLAQTCRQSPLMILSLARPSLLERRPAWNDEAGGARLDLEPLSHEESELLLQTVLRETPQLQPHLRDLVLANTGGIPLYIEEFSKMLVEEQTGAAG